MKGQHDMDKKEHKVNRRGKYVKRRAVPFDTFIDSVARPVMGQVASGHLKKNLGLVLSAVCGGIGFLPYQTEYTGETNPLQTLSSHLSHYRCQPNHVPPDKRPLEELEIRVFPMFNQDVPPAVIERFIDLCNKYNIDHEIFTKKGGTIRVTKDLLRVVAYFASDKGLHPNESIWGSIKPLHHIPKYLLENEDIPQRIKNKVEGRKRGRPPKTPKT